MANFWPITNLTTIGKNPRVSGTESDHRHIQGFPNVSPLQSVYQALHSIETAMTRMVNDLRAAADNKTTSVLLFLGNSTVFHPFIIIVSSSVQKMSSDSMT